MVLFWILNIQRHVVFRGPKNGPYFWQPPMYTDIYIYIEHVAYHIYIYNALYITYRTSHVIHHMDKPTRNSESVALSCPRTATIANEVLRILRPGGVWLVSGRFAAGDHVDYGLVVVLMPSEPTWRLRGLNNYK